jgi:hypothetical protein
MKRLTCVVCKKRYRPDRREGEFICPRYCCSDACDDVFLERLMAKMRREWEAERRAANTFPCSLCGAPCYRPQKDRLGKRVLCSRGEGCHATRKEFRCLKKQVVVLRRLLRRGDPGVFRSLPEGYGPRTTSPR